MIDATSGYHLWSENFDRDLKDIFSVQSEIATAIVAKLRISLGKNSADWVAPTVDSEAYDLYLRGRQLLNARRVAEIRESIDYFQRAVARDPSFAPALAAMAVAYVSLPIFSDEPVEQLHTMAAEAVQRVLILSPENAEAHAVRAWLAQYEGEWRRAEFGYFAATNMDTNDVTTRVWYSGFLLVAGKLEQGQVQAERALELDPDNPLTRAAAATAAMVRGENESCAENAAAARQIGFSVFVNNLEGICLARLGRLDDASKALISALGPLQDDNALASLAAALPGAASLEEAAASAMTDAEFWQNDPWAMWLAAAAGRPDQAFARINEGFVDGGYLHAQLLWTPEAAVLRGDARFLEIMRDSGIARIWRNDPPDLCSNESGSAFSCF